MQYDWPGNIRELRNCVTRTLAFTESELVLAEHVLFDERGSNGSNGSIRSLELEAPGAPLPLPMPALPPATSSNERERRTQEQPLRTELNPRQQKALGIIARNGGISRSEYQAAVGDSISVRTAQYDLHDLVAKGLLKKSGRGPSSRYLVTQSYVV